MVIRRGDIWWAELPEPSGSTPGYRRPVIIVQDDAFNESRIATVIVVVVTSSLRLAAAPGNVWLSAQESGLPRDSVINLSQIITVNKSDLTSYIGSVASQTLGKIDSGLRLVLDL
jgi:mRNA interferase MazF